MWNIWIGSVQTEKGKTMCENVLCTDNRFELIEKYKAKLIEATNIETDAEDMAAIDSILFRFWQMGWLDKLETVEAITRDSGITIPPHPVMGEREDK